MEKQTLLIIGLIGGILAVVGVFLPWIGRSYMGGWSAGGLSDSGWNLRTTRVISFYSPYPALAGGIIALLGGFALLNGKRPVGFLLPIGGITAIAGGLWGYFDVSAYLSRVVTIPELHLSSSYGFYICIVGGVLALIGGTLSLKTK
ncbi:MAG: hypothetical protein CEE41_04010 [Hadesarchaea archaeon B3_Hades]|nr:MAG: hypothetical protein CEE41_04010 [Hadesarchaea archaeon B3_Hades]